MWENMQDQRGCNCGSNTRPLCMPVEIWISPELSVLKYFKELGNSKKKLTMTKLFIKLG